MKILRTLLTVLCMVGLIIPAYAADSLIEAFTEGKPYADIRLRYETVDQDGLNEDAESSTIRTRLGFKTEEYMSLKGVLEVENVSYLDNDRYNDTVNGRTTYPTVADPENTEINQAYLEYSGISDTVIKAGRQTIVLDNQRFIGAVGWRQNNQNFDAVVVANTSIEDTTVIAGYAYNVNRIFGEQSAAGDFEAEIPLYNISYTGLPIGKITTYGYFFDFTNDSPANSNRTFGISLSGDTDLTEDVMFKYYAEYARQSDYGDNTTDYDANYYHVAPALVWKGITTTLGYEVLGSDNGTFAFRTPAATGHKFNGWADKFLTTPNTGLQDLYVDITYKFQDLDGVLAHLNDLKVKFQYHDFDADEGSADHGDEWGISLHKPINEHVYAELKYADYDADNTATDTQKLVLGLGIKF